MQGKANLVEDEDADQVDGGAGGRDEQAGVALDGFLELIQNQNCGEK